ncbi:MAG: hypothetical protein ACK5M7_14765 [Draconibacterium sp.]
MIFRTTNFLKVEKDITKKLEPNLPANELGKALFIRNFKLTNETPDEIRFAQGTYNKNTGVVQYSVQELPLVLQKLERLHKATTNSRLFYLNIFFGVSLLFFSLSAFFMYVKSSAVLKKGIMVAIGGLIFALLMVFL